jgi:hypothetical protein
LRVGDAAWGAHAEMVVVVMGGMGGAGGVDGVWEWS